MQTKTCTGCRDDKPATPEFFNRSRGRLTARCRDCHKARMKVENRERYAANRARALLRTYRSNDRRAGRESTLTETQLAAIIERPCHYCGTTDALRGADRIENALGHTAANVVPACRTCNMVRNDIFDVDEMRLLGAVVAQIMAARL